MRKIVTTLTGSTVPYRGVDWCAYFDGDEGDECAPRGFGATEAEARQDLIDNCDDEEVVMDHARKDDVAIRLLNAAIEASQSIPEGMRAEFLKALSAHHHKAADLMASAAIRLEGRAA